jgi:hypothetical protein
VSYFGGLSLNLNLSGAVHTTYRAGLAGAIADGSTMAGASHLSIYAFIGSPTFFMQKSKPIL